MNLDHPRFARGRLGMKRLPSIASSTSVTLLIRTGLSAGHGSPSK